MPVMVVWLDTSRGESLVVQNTPEETYIKSIPLLFTCEVYKCRFKSRLLLIVCAKTSKDDCLQFVWFSDIEMDNCQ